MKHLAAVALALSLSACAAGPWPILCQNKVCNDDRGIDTRQQAAAEAAQAAAAAEAAAAAGPAAP